MTFGREVIRIVAIDQPFCSRTWGDAFASPTGGCTAILGTHADKKCYNTRATCPVPEVYDPGTLTLKFCEQQLDVTRYYGNVIPSIETDGVDTTPAEINLGGLEKSASALGQREVVTITFKDHQHSDFGVDKYRLERPTGAAAAGSPSVSFDPYEQGTFWGKWIARNPYFTSYALRVYEGYLGDALADMRVRHYLIDKVDGPKEGSVKITAKDQFSKIEARKAVAPEASRGELAAGITAIATTASLSPAGIGDLDYTILSGSPDEFYVAIGDEIIRCSRSGDTLNLLERGALNTTAGAHDQEDLVQRVLVYTADSPHDIAYDLLVNYSAIPAANINKTQWDSLASSISALYTARIAEPTPVEDLLSELALQAGFTLWADVSDGFIKFMPLRAGSITPTVNDRDWIVDGSLSIKRQVEKRVSQVWVYYGLINPTESLEEAKNYSSRIVTVDPNAEDSTQYGEPAIFNVFSRWIPQFGRTSAEQTGERLLAMFRDPPIEAKFNIHASQDGELELARYFYLQTHDVQDDTGAEASTPLATVSIARGLHEIEVKGQQVAFSDDPEDNVRRIYIENDSNDLNLRTLHDSVYTAPLGGSPSEVVEFYILSGVTVGSTSASTPAITTGSWPSMSTLPKIINAGRIQGRGGTGGSGGQSTTYNEATNGGNGGTGGTALKAISPIQVDNSSGQIWGGGGGGGGGGANYYAYIQGAGGGFTFHGGGGGGAGAGTQGGITGSGGAGATGSGATGESATDSSGGSGGAGSTVGSSFGSRGGDGGSGGGPGLVGSAGSAGIPGSGADSNFNVTGSGGSAGSAGNYVEGNSLVTWIATGDRRGSVA